MRTPEVYRMRRRRRKKRRGKEGGKVRSTGHRILPQGLAAGHRARAGFQPLQEEAVDPMI